MGERLTLHGAMVVVLRSHGGGWMDRDAIAREISARDLFRRPSDGAHPPSDQLRLRARKYPDLFDCSDTRCSTIRLRSEGSEPAPKRAQTSQRSRVNRPSSAVSDPSESQRGHDDGVDDSARWYEELREEYRPTELSVLLIGESPPDSGSGERRFFYAPTLSRYDNLYRGVAQAVYGEDPDFDVDDKTGILNGLRDDGFWLIDSVEQPINKTSRSSRKRAIEAAAPRLVERCSELSPRGGVIICHGVVYEATAHHLRDAGITVLHDVPIPFPLGNWRAEFVRLFRKALR